MPLVRATLEVARWLAAQRAVQTVLHPALPSCPRHAVRRCDFMGSTSVSSIVFADGTTRAIITFVDALTFFLKVGFNGGE